METRRQFLQKLTLALGVIACSTRAALPAAGARYVGVETSAETGMSKASFFAASGERTKSVQLDFRAHGFAQHAHLQIVFPRRPGNRFAVIDMRTLEIRAVVTAPEDRHFYGHGAFTVDGQHLLVTENNLATLGGSIGIYEVGETIRRVGQRDLPRPGPHELIRARDSDRFLVALGGLETHPDYGRTPLNLDSFRSEIVVFDFATGTMDGLGVWNGSEGVSLRHLAEDDQGRVYVGGQSQDRAAVGNANVLWCVTGDAIEAVEIGADLGSYVSSVAASGSQAVVTSKQTGLVVTIDGHDLVSVSVSGIDGASAVGLSANVRAVSGFNTLWINGKNVAALTAHEFDNHGALIALE
ncbi:MAG: DUF1513 domain-containing protein [Pseudomonadota bacterium]